MKIGYRTVKTAIGVPFALFITQLFGVTNYVSSGILALLCIQPSRKRSIQSARDRFIACILALLFSYVFFEILGYHPIAIGLMLLIFIPTTVLLHIHQGLVTSVVIILNIYTEKMITFSFYKDQVIIIVVGIGVGLLLNLYMPSLDHRLRSLAQQLEIEFKVIFQEISKRILKGKVDWKEKELRKCMQILKEAKRLGAIDEENHLLREHHLYKNYFDMRSKQFELLKSMLILVKELPKQTEESKKIGLFFEDFSKAIGKPHNYKKYLKRVRDLKKEFEHYNLPETYEYEEFATRANLFRLLHELEAFILLNSTYVLKDSQVELKKKTINKRLKLK